MFLFFFLGYWLNIFDLFDNFKVFCDSDDETGIDSDDDIGGDGGNNNSNNNNSDNKDKYKGNVGFEVNKELADNVLEVVKDGVIKAIDKGIEKVASTAAVGTAVGSVAAAVIKSNLPPVQKLGMLVGASAATAAGTQLGLKIVEVAIKNKIENDNIINKSDPDRIPSPDQTFISSLLDKSEITSPLEDLLNIQTSINF